MDSNVYVRFWNAATTVSATYYGDSAIFMLPAGDAFNQAILDFVPSASDPRTTDHPTTPAVSGAAVSTSQINLSWNAPSGGSSAVAGYKIYRDGVIIATVALTNYTDTGLATGTEYCYTIAAFDIDGIGFGQDLGICLRTFVTAGSQMGIYSGLAIQTNAPTRNSSAFVRLILTKTGSFAAKLTIGGERVPLSGQFDGSGNATNTVQRNGLNPLQIILHLDVANATEQITGTASDGTFTFELLADRAGFGPATVCPWAGRYTSVLLPTGGNDPGIPQGYGYGTLSIGTTGSGRLVGVLGDGTKIRANAPISKQGMWPLYASLYKNQGLCIAWLMLSTNQALEATVDWFKPPVPTDQRYPSGFATMVDLTGAKYVSAALGGPSVAGNRLLTLGGGNLVSNIVKSVIVDASGKVTVLTPGMENLSLRVVLTTGRFKGSFTHPVLNKLVKLNGQLVQPQNTGAGLFLGSTEGGFATLELTP